MTQKGRKQIFWTEVEDEIVTKFYPTAPKEKICSLLGGRTWSAITTRGKHLGLRRDRIEIERDLLDFSLIDSEFKAYFLGLLASDGNVNKTMKTVELRLHGEDGNFLYELAAQIGSKARVVKRPARICSFTGRYGSPITELRMSSTKLCYTLVKYGIVPKKSLILQPPDELPIDYIRHFIRGYTDGDGSVSYAVKKSVRGPVAEVTIHSGSKDILEWINNRFLSFYQHKNKVNRGNQTWRLHYAGSSAYYFVKYAYENAQIALPRKYAIAKDILSECNEKGIKIMEDRDVLET